MRWGLSLVFHLAEVLAAREMLTRLLGRIGWFLLAPDQPGIYDRYRVVRGKWLPESSGLGKNRRFQVVMLDRHAASP